MALCDVHFFSNVLQKHVGMYVLVPNSAEPPFATLYLLHGLSDDYTGWQRRTRIEPYADKHSLMVVMPDGFRGFYTDNAEGPAYGKYFADELIATVERMFPAKRARASRGVGGLSMGGYGALRLALGYPHVFASANSHSGALMAGSRTQPRPGGPLPPAEFHRIFGKDPRGTEHDLLALAQRCASHGTVPKVRIDCGVDDDLIGDNRELHAKFESIGLGHEYQEFPGAHDWDYWDLHVREALAFHAKHLS